MQIPPSVSEAQEVIAQQWSRVGGGTPRPPRVLRTLVFFSHEDGLEAFAVVDTGGRECFTLGGWDIETINWEADLARGSKNRPAGSQVSVGGIKRVLVSIDGKTLPTDSLGQTPQDYAGWLNAFTRQEEVTARWKQTLQGQDSLREMLRTRRNSLQAAKHKTQVFAELGRHSPCVGERLQAQERLEHAFRELLEVSGSAAGPVTAAELERVTSLSRRLREHLECCLTEDARQLQPLEEDHAKLQQEIWQRAAFTPSGQGSLSLEITSQTLHFDL